jgi:cobalt/nickel transport system ATP-binding protein
MKPEILLLDEPTAGLDYQGTEDLLAVLEQLEQDGTTLVFSTHDVELAYRFANEVALFHNGKVLAQGPIVEILSNQDLTREAHLEAPLLLKLGLQAQKSGMTNAGDPLPRTAEAALKLFGWKPS